MSVAGADREGWARYRWTLTGGVCQAVKQDARLRRLQAEGLTTVAIDCPERMTSADICARVAETRAVVASGADVVFQATILDAP